MVVCCRDWVAESAGEIGRRIGVIDVVSIVPAFTSSNRDRRRANIAVLALSWERENTLDS